VFGKWHLGDKPQFLPLQHGFDEYFGLPYSNDMWPFHPTGGKSYPNLPLISGNKVLNPKVTGEDQSQLTTQYTEHAVSFIERNRDKPFFLYVPHSMPHVPLFVSDKFKGKSKRGLFGDVISEIDWSVGQILDALKKHDLDENTLVIFTSDNGPWLSYGDHAGSAAPLRHGKGTAWDGGQRVPCVMRWPGKIPAGQECRELAATIDVLPTLADFTGAELPTNKLDGLSIRSLLLDEKDSKSPHESYYFYWGQELHAVRSGVWKLHFPHSFRMLKSGGEGGKPGPYVESKTDLALFNLETDIGELKNVAERHPDIVARLTKYADVARAELGDSLTSKVGTEVRKHGEASK
jgi:arylsulfatase A